MSSHYSDVGKTVRRGVIPISCLSLAVALSIRLIIRSVEGNLEQVLRLFKTVEFSLHAVVDILTLKRSVLDESFLCVVKTQKRWSNKISKTELTKITYTNQVMCKYRVDPQRAGLTLIAELTWSKLGLKGVLKK